MTFEEYLRNRMVQDFGTNNIYEASEKYVEELRKDLIRYDNEKYGKIPSILLHEIPRELRK